MKYLRVEGYLVIKASLCYTNPFILKKSFNLYTNLLFLLGVQKSLLAVGEMMEGMLTQRRKRDEEDRVAQQERLQKRTCMVDLARNDPKTDKKRIEQEKGGLYPECCVWLIEGHQEFADWCRKEDSCIAWIKGEAGRGKTMLMCSIIDSLESKGHRLAYTFCRAGELDDVSSVLRKLIYFLADAQPYLFHHVENAWRDHSYHSFDGPNSWIILKELFEQMVHDPSMQPVIFLIDALDECQEKGLELVDLILDTSSDAGSSSRVRWIVSSRNHSIHVEDALQHSMLVDLRVELLESVIQGSLDTYIQRKVESLAGRRGYSVDEREKVQQMLKSGAGGTFLWVSLVCKELQKVRNNIEQILQTLEKMPSGLDDLYKRMMTLVANSKPSPDPLKEILKVVSVARRPVTLKELGPLLGDLQPHRQDAEETSVIRSYVEQCGSFLVLREDSIFLVHQSARNFLLEDCKNDLFLAGVAAFHRVLSLRALLLLNSTLSHDVYGLRHPGARCEDIEKPEPDPLAPAAYACVHWADHFEAAQWTTNQEAWGALQDFFSQHFLHWMEALGILGGIATGAMAMHKIRTLAQASAASNQMSRLLQDAYQFYAYFQVTVEVAPLQVYAAGFIFSPSQNMIKRQFKREEVPQWVELKSSIDITWNNCIHILEYPDPGSFLDLKFLENSRLLVLHSADWVQIWDTNTGICIKTMGEADNRDRPAVFSSDGRKLAWSSWGRPDSVETLDLTSMDRPESLVIKTGIETSIHDANVAISDDKQKVAAALRNGDMGVWDVNNGNHVILSNYPGQRCWGSMQFLGGSCRYLLRSGEDSIQIWDSTGGTFREIPHGGKIEYVMALHGDDTKVISLGSGMIKVWDVVTERAIRVFEGYRRLALSGNNQTLAMICDGPREQFHVHVWKLHGNYPFVIEGGDSSLYPYPQLELSTDGQFLGVSWSDTIHVWNTVTGICLHKLHHIGLWRFALSSDGLCLVSHSSKESKGKAMIWDLTLQAVGEPQQHANHPDEVVVVDFANNGKRLASVSRNTTTKVWEDNEMEMSPHNLKYATKEEVGVGRRVTSAQLSWDGQKIAFGSLTSLRNLPLEIWNVDGNRRIRIDVGIHGATTHLAFSKDDTVLASATAVHIDISDCGTGDILHRLKLPSEFDNWKHRVNYYPTFEALVFLEDRWKLASGLYDGRIVIWNTATGAHPNTLSGHNERIDSLGYFKLGDIRWLASCSRDTAIKLWNIDSGVCIRSLSFNSTISHMNFESMPVPSLLTNIGSLDLGHCLSDPSPGTIPLASYGISNDEQWILYQGRRTLWLPQEYRPSAPVGGGLKPSVKVARTKIAIGTEDGKVLCFSFSRSVPE